MPTLSATPAPPTPSAAPPTPPAQPAPSAPPTPLTTGDAAARVELHAANGCGALAAEDRLAQAAQGHAQDLRDHGRFEHTGSAGLTLSDRLMRAGYPFGWAGENIVGGVASAARL